MLHRCDKLTRKKKNTEKVMLSQSPFPPQEKLYSKGRNLYLSEQRGQVAWAKSPKRNSSKTWEGVLFLKSYPCSLLVKEDSPMSLQGMPASDTHTVHGLKCITHTAGMRLRLLGSRLC